MDHMVVYCQECGKQVEETFQFCPFCGKKLIKPKICSNCGTKLEDNFAFCPECGKKWDSSKKSSAPPIIKTKKEDKPKKFVEKKPVEKPKSKDKKIFSNIKLPGKNILIALFVIFIVVIVAVAVIVVNPFDNSNGGSTVGGEFSITVESSYSEPIHYYFIVDGINTYGGSDSPYNIESTDGLVTYNINNNDLIIKRNTHEISFRGSIDGISWISSQTIDGVTKSASFEIFDDDGNLGINCTGSE